MQKQRGKGSGTIERKGNGYRLRVVENGQRRGFALLNADGSPCRKMTEARKAAQRYAEGLAIESREKLAEYVAETRHLKESRGTEVERLWAMYLASPNRGEPSGAVLRQNQRRWERLVEWLAGKGARTLEDITPQIVSPFCAQLAKEVSGKTYNEYLGTYRQICRCLIEASGSGMANPFASIRNRRKESIPRREFTEDQVRQIFRYLDEHPELRDRDEMRLLMMLCCFTGARGQDACLMLWENIDLERGVISFTPRKTAKATGGRGVILPLHPVLRDSLFACQARKGYVLPSLAKRYAVKGSVQVQAMKIIAAALGTPTKGEKTEGRAQPANIYSLHSFRHSFVSFCANSGVPLEVVASIVGHGSPAMTRHYTHITDEARRGVLAALPGDNGLEAQRQRLVRWVLMAQKNALDAMEAYIPTIDTQRE
jgi:integrase